MSPQNGPPEGWQPIVESDRAPVPNRVGAEDQVPDKPIRVTVLVRPNPEESDRRRALRERAQEGTLPGQRGAYATREEVIEAALPRDSDVAAVVDHARSAGLAVVGNLLPPGMLVLEGALHSVVEAFWTQPPVLATERFTFDGADIDHPFRERYGEIFLPPELHGIVPVVTGIDDRITSRIQMHIQMHANVRPVPVPRDGDGSAPNIQMHDLTMGVGTQVGNGRAGYSFTPRNLARYYSFPDGDGEGQTIGIVSLGGTVDRDAIADYFGHIETPVPVIDEVVTDEAAALSCSDQEAYDRAASNENLLDIQIAASIAPRARIKVYRAPNTARGYLHALAAAVYDTTEHRPTVITSSWGLREAGWTDQARHAINRMLQDAASLGVTVCVASGDFGAQDEPRAGAEDPQVDFPAASRYALACGGTQLSLPATAGTDPELASAFWEATEEAWKEEGTELASGGGVSDYFAKTYWQDDITVTRMNGQGTSPPERRAVPDVAGCAAPGYVLRFADGANPEQEIGSGTSAAAPQWAGLVARMNQRLGRSCGYLNPCLYKVAKAGRGFLDITRGDNRGFDATDEWDACTGLGRMHGEELLDALR